jgi:N-acetyl-gamma-glutamylphosphate reductase
VSKASYPSVTQIVDGRLADTSAIRTGATGYIGGDALSVITQAHPEWELTVLVRNQETGKTVTRNFPKAKLVFGNLEDSELLEEEAKKADIVYRMATPDSNVVCCGYIHPRAPPFQA